MLAQQTCIAKFMDVPVPLFFSLSLVFPDFVRFTVTYSLAALLKSNKVCYQKDPDEKIMPGVKYKN